MEDDTRNPDPPPPPDAIRRKCYRGMAWGLALYVIALCLIIAAPLPLPGEHPVLSVAGWWVVTWPACGAGIIVLLCSCARLAPYVWGDATGRGRARTWGLRILGALTVAPLWAWGLALLIPAARREGDRRTGWLAFVGGLLGFAVVWVLHLRATLVITPLGWGLYAAMFLSSALLWFALRRLVGYGSRALRRVGWGLVLAVLLAVVALPGWRVPRMAERADALVSAVLASAGYADANAPFAAARPPVAPGDDPFEELSADVLEADADAWRKFTPPYLQGGEDACQLPAVWCDSIDAWFAAHPALVAAADIVSSPGYRSCLPGATSPRDIGLTRGGFLEPRFGGGAAMPWISVLAMRARVACARGDIPAAGASVARIANLSEALSREPMTIGKLLGRIGSKYVIQYVLPERLDLWDDAFLAAFADFLETQARIGPALFAQAMVGEMISFDATLPDLTQAWNPDIFLHPMRTPVNGALARWLLSERIAYAEEMRRALDTAAAIAAMPASPGRAAAYAAFCDSQDETSYSYLLSTLMPGYPGMFGSLVLDSENDLAILRTAAAVARWRRERGTLPPTLDALVPDYLPALPLDAVSGLPFAYDPAPDASSFVLRFRLANQRDNPIRFFLDFLDVQETVFRELLTGSSPSEPF